MENIHREGHGKQGQEGWREGKRRRKVEEGEIREGKREGEQERKGDGKKGKIEGGEGK